jgi:hypothetical protein
MSEGFIFAGGILSPLVISCREVWMMIGNAMQRL